MVSALVNDALALLAALDIEAITAAGGDAAEAVALLALVAGQDVEPAEGSDGSDGRWRIARKVAPDRVVSMVDPDARHAHKTRSQRRDGFKAHVVVEPVTGLATAVAITKACGPGSGDAAAGQQLLDADPTIGPAGDGLEVLGDSAYGTGEMLHKLAAAGRVPVIKPWPTRPAVVGGFTIDDFTYDQEAGTLTCPAGITRTLTPKRAAHFKAACGGCPLRERCTTAKSGRTIQVHKHEALRRAHRELAAEPGFQEVYRQQRPMVERSIAWLTRGNRRVPHRGVEKNHAWFHHRAAAVNLKRMLALGLNRHEGAWRLA